MGDRSSGTTRQVRRQYEDYPYPQRDPAEEKTRLLPTYLDHLSLINHYCFRGRQDFRGGFRALVAGGGTGDAAVYLGEQLRDTDAEIVYLDLSEASMAVARARAEARGLDNITWRAGSLLELPRMHLAPFDYVNCVGVLHHLDSPEAGLEALCDVLAPEGAMGLMVYARYGRTGVYQMQELMRRVNRGVEDDQTRVDNTRAVLAALPETNWFKRGEGLIRDHEKMGDAGLYDMFLHSTDRAYSVPEVHELLEGAGLRLVAFEVRQRAIFTPGLAYRDPGLLKLLSRLSAREQQAVLELINGTITKHAFYASRLPDTVASPDDADNVPFFHLLPGLGKSLHARLAGNPRAKRAGVQLPRGIQLDLEIGPYTAGVLRQIDGRRPLKEIARQVRRAHPARPSARDVLAAFGRLYAALNPWDLLLLRHASAGPPQPVPALGGAGA